MFSCVVREIRQPCTAKYKSPEMSWTVQDLHLLLPTSLLYLRWSAARQRRHRQSKLLKVVGRRQRIGCIRRIHIRQARRRSETEGSLCRSLKSTARLEKRKNIMAALKFDERRQGESESFESFVTDLKILVKDCGYQEEARMVRDRFPLQVHKSSRKVPRFGRRIDI